MAGHVAMIFRVSHLKGRMKPYFCLLNKLSIVSIMAYVVSPMDKTKIYDGKMIYV